MRNIYDGPCCADCGASVQETDLVWRGGADSGQWFCADDDDGCAERTAHRYGGDRLLAHALAAHDPREETAR